MAGYNSLLDRVEQMAEERVHLKDRVNHLEVENEGLKYQVTLLKEKLRRIREKAKLHMDMLADVQKMFKTARQDELEEDVSAE